MIKMEDRKGIIRGSCNNCDCPEYELPSKDHACNYCLHPPTSHDSLKEHPYKQTTNVTSSQPINTTSTSPAPPQDMIPEIPEMSELPEMPEPVPQNNNENKIEESLNEETRSIDSNRSRNRVSFFYNRTSRPRDTECCASSMTSLNASRGDNLDDTYDENFTDDDTLNNEQGLYSDSDDASLLTPDLNGAERTNKMDDRDLGHVVKMSSRECKQMALGASMEIEIENMDHDLSEQEGNEDVKENRPIPVKRPCFYCSEYRCDVFKHLLTVHHNEKDMKVIKRLPIEVRQNKLKILRLEGMSKENIKRRGKGEEPIFYSSSKRRATVQCGSCLVPFHIKYLKKHKKHCTMEEYPIPDKNEDENLNLSLFDETLNTFQNDAAGNFIKNNKDIQCIGTQLFQKFSDLKGEELLKKQKTTRTCLRYAARIYLHVCSQMTSDELPLPLKDIFQMRFLDRVKVAINYFLNTTQLNPKSTMYYAYTNAIKTVGNEVRVDNLRKNLIDIAKGNEDFVNCFIKNERTVKTAKRALQKTEDQPEMVVINQPETDIQKLKNFILKEFEDLMKPSTQWDKNEYLRLRRCVFCRLIFFNGRKTSDVARLQIKHWLKAKRNKSEVANVPGEKLEIFRHFKVVSFTDGSGYVEVMIPKSCYKPLDILMNSGVRNSANVYSANRFMFPATGVSKNRVSALNQFYSCCEESQVKKTIYSKESRHIVCAEFAAWEVSEDLREMMIKYQREKCRWTQKAQQEQLPTSDAQEEIPATPSLEEPSCNSYQGPLVQASSVSSSVNPELNGRSGRVGAKRGRKPKRKVAATLQDDTRVLLEGSSGVAEAASATEEGPPPKKTNTSNIDPRGKRNRTKSRDAFLLRWISRHERVSRDIRLRMTKEQKERERVLVSDLQRANEEREKLKGQVQNLLEFLKNFKLRRHKHKLVGHVKHEFPVGGVHSTPKDGE